MSETAVLLCGHGSRDPEAVAEFEEAAAALRVRLANLAPGGDFATGYLEFARPTIGEGLAALTARGGSSRSRACCSPRATSRTISHGR